MRKIVCMKFGYISDCFSAKCCYYYSAPEMSISVTMNDILYVLWLEVTYNNYALVSPVCVSILFIIDSLS